MNWKIYITLALALFQWASSAQEESSGRIALSLSEEQQSRFDQHFFEAAQKRITGRLDEAITLYRTCLKIDSNNFAVNFALAEIHLEREEPFLADPYLKKAHRLNPENPWVLRSLWHSYRQQNDAMGQNNALEALHILEPENPEYIYELAHVRLLLNDGEGAIKALDELEKLMGRDEVITDQKVRIYMSMGDAGAAETELRNLAEEFPNNVEFRGRLAEFLNSIGRRDDALTEYRRVLRIDPDEPRAHLYFAERDRGLDRVDSSLHHLGIALGSPQMDIDTKVAVMASFYLLVEEDKRFLDVALRLLDTIIYTHPINPKGYALKADFTIRENRIEESLHLWKMAVSLPDGNLWPIWHQILQCDVQLALWDSLLNDAGKVLESFPNQPAAYLYNGLALSRLKRYDEAVEILESGMMYTMGNQTYKQQFWLQLGEAYHHLGDSEQSNGYLDLILNVDENNHLALNNYAYFLAERDEQLDKAFEMINRAVLLAPNDGNYWDTYAWVLYKMEQFGNALEKIEKAEGLMESPSWIIADHKGDILWELNRKVEAVKSWREAIESGGSGAKIEIKIKKSEQP